MKSISILGSTGSIGVNTLKVVEHLKDEFRVVALGAGGNVEVLAEQVKKFQPELVAVKDENCAEELLRQISDSQLPIPNIVAGENVGKLQHTKKLKLSSRQLLVQLALSRLCGQSKPENELRSLIKKRS